MRERKCIRFIAECSKGFWDKKSCLEHEVTCKCWSNPRNRACKACFWGNKIPYEEDTGYGGFWECENKENTNDGHISGLENVDYISVNCDFYRLIN